jgi:TPR repeat protein
VKVALALLSVGVVLGACRARPDERTCGTATETRRMRESDLKNCFNIAIELRTSAPERATPIFDATCEADLADGCGALGLILTTKGKAFDPKRGVTLLTRACDARVASACNNLGRCHYSGIGVEEDRARGITLWKRACELGDKVACSNAEKAPP